MTKHLQIAFSNVEIFRIPAKIIALERAKYYMKIDNENGECDGKTLDEYVEEALSDDYNITDWASNNMNWEDVEHYAVRIKSKPVNYGNEWINAEKRIIEDARNTDNFI